MTTLPSDGASGTWAAPNVGATAPVRRLPGEVAAALGPSSTAREVVGSPVSRLGPRSLRQLLDGGFEVFRFRAAITGGLAAVLVLPLVAAPTIVTAIWWSSATIDDVGNVGLGDPSANPFDVSGLAVWGWLGASLAHTFLAVAVGHLVAGWLTGSDPTRREALSHVLRRTPAVLVAWMSVSAIKAVSFVPCGVGVVFVVPLFALLGPVLGAERLGPLGSVNRAFTLGKATYWRLVAISIGFGVVSGTVRLALEFAPAALGSILGIGPGAGLVVSTVVQIVASVVLAIVLVGTTTLTYLDARVRIEGLDLELTSAKVLDHVGR